MSNSQIRLFEEPDPKVRVLCPTSAVTGETIELTLASEGLGCQFFYYLLDLENGEQQICGPYRDRVSGRTTVVYRTPGKYEIRVKAIALSDTKTSGWSPSACLSVVEARPSAGVVSKSISYSGNAIFGDAFSWRGILLDRTVCLESFWLDTPETGVFPAAFRVDYSTDGGLVWYPVPRYDLIRLDYTMDFPHPRGRRLVFPMGGLVANALRFVALSDGVNQEKCPLEPLPMGVWGKEEFLFTTSAGGTEDADLNNFWTIFGSAAMETETSGSHWLPSDYPYKGGVAGYGVTEWQEWTGLQLNWAPLPKDRAEHRASLLGTRVDVDDRGNLGYVWPSSGDPKHLGVHLKYSTNPTFLLAVRNYMASSGERKDFLQERDRTGRSMGEKIDLAMEYMLNVEEGRDGLLVITDPHHDGTATGGPSNYWDNFTCFGYLSAYENALFHGSLLAMADLCEMRECGDAGYYRDLAAKLRQRYNELFWESEKGRYIGSIDVNGERHDLGFTFVNLMAIVYGLAERWQAEAILDWLDGKRIVQGDDSVGEDIYAFGYAPRSTTVAVERGGEPYCWFDWNKAIWPGPGGSASFGTHVENGGVIFYVSYYDLMARMLVQGPEGAGKRFRKIMEEFHVDTLRRNRFNEQGADWVEGILGPFPESGLVPAFFVRGFLGIWEEVNGLRIAPKLPSTWESVKVSELWYQGKLYRVETSRTGSVAELVQDGERIVVRVPVGCKVLLRPEGTLAPFGNPK